MRIFFGYNRVNCLLLKKKGLNPGTIVRELARKHLKGGGSGQAFFATAGGSDARAGGSGA